MESNPLAQYFRENRGPLMHKWLHYFDVYDRHLRRYVGTPVTLLEIGVFHGGSLKMWQTYLGPQARIVGIDIDPRCKVLEDPQTQILIGDQADPQFLAEVREKVGTVDVVIDDGGHHVEQQVMSFEELFPVVCEGGTYIVEDLHTNYWDAYGGGVRLPGTFIEHVKSLVDEMNAWHAPDSSVLPVSDLTRSVRAVHAYDSIVVLEKGLVLPPSHAASGVPVFEFSDAEVARDKHFVGHWNRGGRDEQVEIGVALEGPTFRSLTQLSSFGPNDAAAKMEELRRELDVVGAESTQARRELEAANQRLALLNDQLSRQRQELESRERDIARGAAEADQLRADLDRLRVDVERGQQATEVLTEHLTRSTELLRREESTVVRPLLRRAYRLLRRMGGRLSPEQQRRVRAALAPVVTRVAPGSPQSDAYDRARRRGTGIQLSVGTAARAGAWGPLPTDRRSFDVIVLPVIDWHFRIQRPQHLSTELNRLGHRVVYLSTDFDRLRPGAGAFSLLERIESRLWLARLACPAPIPRIYRDPLAPHQVGALAEALDVMVHELGLSDVVLVVQHPFWEPIVRASGQHFSVYDLIDDHGGFEGTEPWVLEAEQRLITGCDLVSVTAPTLAAKAPGSVLVRNAAEVERFATRPRTIHRSGRPTVGYFGAIAHWFDAALVERCARLHPDWDFVLIGSTVGGSVEGLRALPNVQMPGELSYEELPAHLHGFDVCMIPFRVIPLTEHTNPVKAYEYLSAGKPVVATGLPEVRLMAPMLHVAEDHDAFVAALDEAMAESGDDELAAQRRAWVQEHTWQRRASVLEESILARRPSVSVVVLCYNNLQFTKSCLESIERASSNVDLQLVLVDNASTDGTPEFLTRYAADRPHVTLVLNDENIGFAAGNNAGLAASTGDYLVMLNNDTVVTDGWLLGLVRHLRDEPALGLIGPVTNNIGNEAKVDVDYASIDDLEVAARHYTSARFRQRLRVPTVAFFCAAMPRKVYEQVGALDEDFGIGFFEDDDYCRRVEAAGFDIAIAEDVFVHHHLSASFDALGAAYKQELFEKNKAIYEAKWGPWTPHVYRSDTRT
jgi:GT2 family glycosyltransferase/glycosyltransferase involved in cell wall biosynthesis